MNRLILRPRLWLLAAALLSLALVARAAVPHADFTLDVRIDPLTHELEVHANIDLSERYAGQAVEFLLTDAVEIVASEPVASRQPDGGSRGFTGINGSSIELAENKNPARYRVQLAPGSTVLNLTYRGTINFALGDLKEQYTRGFRRTAGIIGRQGVYLAGSSLWYPYFSDELISFRLHSNVPEGWQLISQGNGTSGNEQGMAHWDSDGAEYAPT